MTASPFLLVGRALSGLVIVFTATDAMLKLIGRPDVLQAGLDPALPLAGPLVGAALLLATLLYALPRTAPIGALLLGAGFAASIAGQIRSGDPDPSRLLFDLYVGLLMGVGLLLRRPALRHFLLGAAGLRT